MQDVGSLVGGDGKERHVVRAPPFLPPNSSRHTIIGNHVWIDAQLPTLTSPPNELGYSVARVHQIMPGALPILVHPWLNHTKYYLG